jgi:uncharacterized protein
MPSIRALLNELKWTKDLSKAEIWYRHRGAPNDTMIISGTDIINISRSFLETTTASIPFHRILKILYNGEVVFNRSQV